MLLAACIGQRGITTPQRYATLDCEILIKKQRKEIRAAERHARTNERRKSLLAKSHNNKTSLGKNTKPVPSELPASVENEVDDLQAYSPPLVSAGPASAIPGEISRELFFLDPILVNHETIKPLRLASKSVTTLVEFRNDTAVWTTILLGGALGIVTMALFQRQAKSLSRWGKENKLKARSAVVVVKMATGAACLVLGGELYNAGYTIPEFASIPSLGLLGFAFVFYPSRYFASGAPAFGFLERKFYDASIFTAGAIVMLYAGNQVDVSMQTAHHAQTVAQISLPDRQGQVNKKISIVKREFKQKLKTLLQDPPKEMSRAKKTALTVLAILAAIVLTFGVASLTCSIACSGSEFAAFLVGIGGMALIIWALAATIRSIHRRPTKKPLAST
jgi:hypothetical protein